MRGHVRLRGDVWYAVLSVGKGNERKTVWRSLPECKGKREAETECRRLVREIDTGDFVMTDNSTVAQWIEHWLSIGCPGRKRKAVGNKTRERYGELLRTYILPSLGNRPLQKLQSTEIDALYARLREKISERTLLNAHVVFASALAMAFRTRKIGRNPLLDVVKVPSPGEADHGVVLDKDELRTLVRRFKERDPVHTVAARCGHDPATLLRSYAKRTRKADESAAAVTGSLSAGVLS